MTVCVSVKVSEGLVLAADSVAAIQGTLQGPDGKTSTGILKTYEHVRKLSHIKDYPIGTLAWGTALVGARSVESLIKEYEYSLPSLAEEEEKIKERRMRGSPGEPYTYTVQGIADRLLKHVLAFYQVTFSSQPPDQWPPLGILVSGYSSGQFFPQQWLIDLPKSNNATQVRPDVNERPWFGAMWFGLTDAIVRLHWGRDDQAIALLSEHFNVPAEQIATLLEQLQYPIAFDGMPLQDAIDYAVYLVNVAIGRFRFVVGAPLCGGEIDVAVITPNAFTWVQRKSWKVRAVLAQQLSHP
jgi:hypothetical protein